MELRGLREPLRRRRGGFEVLQRLALRWKMTFWWDFN